MNIVLPKTNFNFLYFHFIVLIKKYFQFTLVFRFSVSFILPLLRRAVFLFDFPKCPKNSLIDCQAVEFLNIILFA